MGNPVHIVDLELNHLAMAEHNEKFWSGCSWLPPRGEREKSSQNPARITLGEPMRCCQAGKEKLRESHLFEMAACEEASATR